MVHLIRHIEVMLKVCHSDSVASDSPRPSSPASALRAPPRRSLSPDTTKFSSSGRSSFQTGRASRSLAPPTGPTTSYRPYCGVESILDALLGGLQKLAVSVPAVHGSLARQTWQRKGLAR